MLDYVLPTPWDTQAFTVNTYEILYESDIQLKQTVEAIIRHSQLGHYTLKIDPLASKKILNEFGFYYCDTLIEPYCNHDRLISYSKEEVFISKTVDFESLNRICQGAFVHGRFHRDFSLEKSLADRRYSLWLKELLEKRQVFALMYIDQVAGFFGFSENKILLHALSGSFRGRGLAKYFWSCACQELFKQGFSELSSSISASNLAVLNLYVSLGFKFRKPLDVYHWSFGK